MLTGENSDMHYSTPLSTLQLQASPELFQLLALLLQLWFQVITGICHEEGLVDQGLVDLREEEQERLGELCPRGYRQANCCGISNSNY